ncbi:YgaP family membrane protein [Draconibacterium halophilum]|uniref:DUF2892 domain-containing protein n=1 Tax=Draconibacterium halophilum TaxID=2706887 RepID=A0A6C0R8S5_9BACT|nr:DUF2892 domain-containing protein [Draconibacterium halophilum]QIA06487.1 DUF2892 domain-containing protein [Draconibacterium halophilum]
MKKNMGIVDRVLRTIVAAVLIFLYVTGTVTGTLGIVALLVAFIFLLTSIFSTCPAYFPLGLKTNKDK